MAGQVHKGQSIETIAVSGSLISSLFIADFNFMHFPGEVRNSIYGMVICTLPRTLNVTLLPSIACTSKVLHHEFMSYYVPQMHFKITSMQDIWYIYTLLDTHPKDFGLQHLTRLTIAGFTSIAHTRARANEVMDFLCQLDLLKHLVLDVTLDSLHHGLQGRIRDIDSFFVEFELFRLSTLPNLANLVINIQPRNISCTPDDIYLLAEMEDRLVQSVKGNVTFIYGR